MQHVANLVVVLEVAPQVRDDLAGELVEQVGLLVVADVVEVDQAADEVVLEPFLGGDRRRARR